MKFVKLLKDIFCTLVEITNIVIKKPINLLDDMFAAYLLKRGIEYISINLENATIFSLGRKDNFLYALEGVDKEDGEEISVPEVIMLPKFFTGGKMIYFKMGYMDKETGVNIVIFFCVAEKDLEYGHVCESKE